MRAPARGARSPWGARQGGGARPRTRALAPRKFIGARATARHTPGCLRQHQLDAWGSGPEAPRVQRRSCAVPEFCLPRARARVCERKRAERLGGRGGRPGGRGAARSSSQGRGALARHGYSKPSTSRKRYFLRLGGFCILSSHRWGWRRPTVRETHWGARLGRCGGPRGHPEPP